MIGQGHKLEYVFAVVGRTINTYKDWRENDPDFRVRVENIRKIQKRTEAETVPDFPTFCAEYLGQPLYNHQLQWLDLLEGRRPRNLHPNQIYEPGDKNFILVNTPPEHAKSTTLTTNYATWRLVKNPNEAMIIVSKTQEKAK